jgi:hypothetical protein
MTRTLQDISEGTCRQILGLVMNFNCHTWIFSLALVEQKCFDQSHPPTPLILSHVAPLTGSIMFMQARDDVIARHVLHPWHLWDQVHQGRFMGVEQEFGDVRGYKTWWHFATFCVIITCHAFNLKC